MAAKGRRWPAAAAAPVVAPREQSLRRIHRCLPNIDICVSAKCFCVGILWSSAVSAGPPLAHLINNFAHLAARTCASAAKPSPCQGGVEAFRSWPTSTTPEPVQWSFSMPASWLMRSATAVVAARQASPAVTSARSASVACMRTHDTPSRADTSGGPARCFLCFVCHAYTSFGQGTGSPTANTACGVPLTARRIAKRSWPLTLETQLDVGRQRRLIPQLCLAVC